MISIRTSNRSSLASKITKSEFVVKKVLSSSQYLELCKNNNQKPEEVVYDSLVGYERQINIMKASLLVCQAKNNFHRKRSAFRKTNDFAQTVPVPFEPLTEEEQFSIKPTYLTDKIKECQQLAELLQERQENQRRAQQQFLKALTQQYEQDNLKNIQAAINIQRLLNRKVFKISQNAFNEINKKAFPQKPSLTTIKNVLTSSFMMLNVKMKETKEYVFRNLLKQFGLESIVDQIDASMKIKGRALMTLKEYPRLNLKRAFWRWYLSTTENGDKLFQNAADKLVLYTNINKTTFFYRLLNKVKVREIKVDPKVKRMTVMFYLYTKMYYERPMREFFEKFKIITSKRGEEDNLSQNFIKCAELRGKDLLKKWIQSVKDHREKQIKKKNLFDSFAKKLVQVSNEKKKWLLEQWKILADKQAKINELKARFLKRILMTKAGRMAQAFKLFKNLPGKANIHTFKKTSKFENGLTTFAQRTLKRALESFKHEYDSGQAQKKRAVIQLIQCTQGGQKKFYNRWKLLVEKTRLTNECKQMNSLFLTLLFVIKSTADMVFLENKESLLKEKALLQLFKNLSGNVSDTFKRWREINTVSKLKDSINQKQKEMVIKVLDGLSKNSKTVQIKDAVLKFRINRRVIEIQRNFLKKLLMSKFGMVAIAFRKIQSIPVKSNLGSFDKASKFEKGLAAFAQKTLKKALQSFKNEYEEGQAQKKRAVIRLIECTQGGQKRYFNLWKSEVQSNNLYTRCQLLQQFFENSQKALERNFSILYRRRSYRMDQISKLHKYFTKMNVSTNEGISYVLEQLKRNSQSGRVNKWFYRAAQTFAVRTRINMQKSLWRLKLNAYTNGILYDASLMVKMKKMFNHIRKCYELTLFRAFLMIDKYGKTVQNLENSQSLSRHTSDYVRIQGSFREESNLFETSNNDIETLKEDQSFLAGRKASLAICESIFNHHVSQQLRRWKYHTQPQKQFEETNKLLQAQHHDTFVFINQSRAISLILQKIRRRKLRDLAYGFRTLCQYGLNLTNETAIGQNFQQKMELINKQNKLIEEVKYYKKQNEEFLQEMELKDVHLDEANKAVAVLSLRINFMITNKFIELVEKVMDNSNWRHLNAGFDGIIEMANENFQQEQSQQIYQQQQEQEYDG